MQAPEVRKNCDFAVFRQIVRGAYNPVTVAKQLYKSPLSLVRSANTCVVCSASNRPDAENIVMSGNPNHYGYYSADDFVIEYQYNEKTKTWLASISPQVIYPLNDDISLPAPPDEKAKVFLDFFADEFERVKIRAEHILDAASTDDMIATHAKKHIQLLRKIFHDSRILFNKNSLYSHDPAWQSDLYILYVFNLFVIRCMVFYGKHFGPYITEQLPREDDLRNTLIKEIPRPLKYPWLYELRPPLYEIMDTTPYSGHASEEKPSYASPAANSNPPLSEKQVKEAAEILQLAGCIKLNCNINVFLAEIFKMLHPDLPGSTPLITAEKKKLVKLLSLAVQDSDGHPLSQATINSVLKPGSVKKRPGV